jgi:hypothetical protein
VIVHHTDVQHRYPYGRIFGRLDAPFEGGQKCIDSVGLEERLKVISRLENEFEGPMSSRSGNQRPQEIFLCAYSAAFRGATSSIGRGKSTRRQHLANTGKKDAADRFS